MTSRPVLMPGGWPKNEAECDACARVLRACGGDFERIFDEPELDLQSFVRHIARVPFFKDCEEKPLFFIRGQVERVVTLLDLCSGVIEATDVFMRATWITYQTAEDCADFLVGAADWGSVQEMARGVYFWDTHPQPTLIVSNLSDSGLVGPALASMESFDSGVIPGVTPSIASGHPYADPSPAFEERTGVFVQRDAQGSWAPGSIPKPAPRREQSATRKGEVMSLESLAQLRAATAESSEFEPRVSATGEQPALRRPNPFVRRNAG